MSEFKVGEEPAADQWQPITTAPKDGTVILGALILDGTVWRVHDMKHNGLAFYTVAGGSLPNLTHWAPMLHMPAPPGAASPHRQEKEKDDPSRVEPSATSPSAGSTAQSANGSSKPLKWLDEIEAELDDTVPYYVPRLIQETRRAIGLWCHTDAVCKEQAQAIQAFGASQASRWRRCGYCHCWMTQPCGEQCVWDPNGETLEQARAASPRVHHQGEQNDETQPRGDKGTLPEGTGSTASENGK